jgi:microcystin-dependent protein
MSGVAWWSQTAATNATADPQINWSEGQSPSSINDSSRAEMASVRKWADDISGAIATGGTSTAFTVTSYQSFDTLTRLNGQMIAFTPHATCGATVTLNVDSLGAKPLRSAPSVELPAGALVQGTPYVAIYNSSDQAFYLQGFYGNPYSIPIGGVLHYTGTSAPNSSFVLPYGQAVSRTTYASYFSLVSTTFGTGDGSTTFNVPDLRGRVIAGLDNMGGSAASRLTSTYFGGTATNLGATGGSESHTLTAGQSAVLTYTNTVTQGTYVTAANKTSAYNNGTQTPAWNSGDTTAQTTGVAVTTTTNAGGNPHNNTQPTMVLGLILRII